MLLGLVVEDRLEITNCFPFPQHTEDDADFDEGKGTLLKCVFRTHSNVFLYCTQMLVSTVLTIIFDYVLLRIYQASLVT